MINLVRLNEVYRKRLLKALSPVPKRYAHRLTEFTFTKRRWIQVRAGRKIIIKAGALSIMVIIVGNGIYDPSSNPGRSSLL